MSNNRNYTTVQALITKAGIYKSEGIKSTNYKEDLKAGYKHVFLWNDDSRTYDLPYVGTVIGLTLQSGNKSYYFDLLPDSNQTQHLDDVKKFGEFFMVPADSATESDLPLEGWPVCVPTNIPVFLRISSYMGKDGKMRDNVIGFGPTRLSLDPKPTKADGFNPSNPFANIKIGSSLGARLPNLDKRVVKTEEAATPAVAVEDKEIPF